jgi:hypothetical protein
VGIPVESRQAIERLICRFYKRLSVDEWPMTRPAYTYVLPKLALAFAFKQKVPELTMLIRRRD